MKNSFKNDDTVDCVTGIILRKNKFLVEKRKISDDIDPGKIMLPGGHIEPNESKEEALKREMKEELDIMIKSAKFICKSFYVASNGEKENLFYYLVEDYDGEPKSLTAEKVLWKNNLDVLSEEVDRNAIRKTKMPPTGFEPATS